MNGWPLSEPAPMSDWYSPTGREGYTDFPAHAPPSAPGENDRQSSNFARDGWWRGFRR